jgi:hypothetical protein
VKSSYQCRSSGFEERHFIIGTSQTRQAKNIVIHTKRSLLDLDSSSHAATPVEVSIGE